jgi:hypothetical protein
MGGPITANYLSFQHICAGFSVSPSQDSKWALVDIEKVIAILVIQSHTEYDQIFDTSSVDM